MDIRYAAIWSQQYINTLPDSAFLYIEPGGSKDGEGKTTPRSLRHFPVRDANGDIDMPHLRDAPGRIQQSNLPQSVKDRAAAEAERLLNAQKSVDVTDKETKSRSVDPLRRKADAIALDFLSDGESRRKPPQRQEPAGPTPELDLKELKRRTRETTLIALSGVDEP